MRLAIPAGAACAVVLMYMITTAIENEMTPMVTKATTEHEQLSNSACCNRIRSGRGHRVCEVEERPLRLGGAAAGDVERRRPSARRAVVARCEFCRRGEENPPKQKGGVQRNEQLRTQ